MSTKPSVADITAKLLTPGFNPTNPAPKLADPVADTPMVLTLDQIAPYSSNPRTRPNPKYESIKESIRNRGLDHPPPVTRRPGDEKYSIRTGGNTRLQILNELWQETKDEKYFRIHCLFRPWTSRGELTVLTGHLAENDERGELMFIDRAVGIEHARELYEQETGKELSLRELSRRLKDDGYSISFSHLGKMRETLQLLIPAIPNILYGGLGKPQIEKLLSLRSIGLGVWTQVHPENSDDYTSVFQDSLSRFDDSFEEFDIEQVRIELFENLSKALNISYEKIIFWVTEEQNKSRRSSLLDIQVQQLESGTRAPTPDGASMASQGGEPLRPLTASAPRADGDATQKSEEKTPSTSGKSKGPRGADPLQSPLPPLSQEERLQGHVVTPVQTTNRVRDIKRQLAEAVNGEVLRDFNSDALVAIPVQAGGLYPISDVWYIEGEINNVHELRRVIQHLALEIVGLAGIPEELFQPIDASIGFFLDPATQQLSNTARITWGLLQSMCGVFSQQQNLLDSGNISDEDRDAFCECSVDFTVNLGELLIGVPMLPDSLPNAGDRITDAALVKLFRLVRLSRRLIDLESRP